MVKWEYHTEYVDCLYPEDLCELGKQGWELVAVNSEIAYFKRPIKEPQPVFSYDEETELCLKVKEIQ